MLIQSLTNQMPIQQSNSLQLPKYSIFDFFLTSAKWPPFLELTSEPKPKVELVGCLILPNWQALTMVARALAGSSQAGGVTKTIGWARQCLQTSLEPLQMPQSEKGAVFRSCKRRSLICLALIATSTVYSLESFFYLYKWVSAIVDNIELHWCTG